MLLYATVDDFKRMKDVGKSGTIVVPPDEEIKIQDYLARSTRYIQRNTLRDFFPWIETRIYPIPHRFQDLSMRRFPMANLKLDHDLLEPLVVNNGDTDLTLNTDYFLLEYNIYPKIEIAVKFPMYWGANFGISPYIRADEPIITVKGIWGYFDHRYPDEAWIDTLETVPVGGMTDSSTSLVLTDIDGEDYWGNTRFVVPCLLRFENELCEVTALNTTTNTLTLIRGARGSTAVAHAAGVKIKKWRVVEDIVSATLQIAKVWRESDNSAGGRLGVSDLAATVELAIPSDAGKIVQLYRRTIM